MPATPTTAHEAPPTQQPLPGLADHAPESRDSHPRSRRHERPAPPPTDDEILGLDTASPAGPDPAQATFDFDEPPADDSARDVIPSEARNLSSDADNTSIAEPANFRGIFEANPELRQAWQDAQAYRETFATPEVARAATAQLADLDRMDALFFSRRPEDHAELARVVATLDPDAFASLAQAITTLANNNHTRRDAAHPPASSGSAGVSPANFLGSAENQNRQLEAGAARAAAPEVLATPQRQFSAATAAQSEFFHAANAAAVEGVLDAIESQVERLLPEGVSKSARNRVVGEIYRELDTTLRSNRQLGQQMRDAFRSGSLDSDHQRAIVSLVTGRARQALPAVAKRVLNEWTSTIVAADNDRRARQHAAERRIDISGASGAATAGRSASPRSIDYARMSDSDILNL